MDVFDLRQRVIGEYADYIRSFFTIRDERIKAKVDAALAEGHRPCVTSTRIIA